MIKERCVVMNGFLLSPLMDENDFPEQSHCNPLQVSSEVCDFHPLPRNLRPAYIFASGLAKMKTNNLLAPCLFSNCREAWSLVIQCCLCLPGSQLREMQSVPWPWAVEPRVQRSEPSPGSCRGSSPLPPNRNTRCIVQYEAETFLRPGLH